MIFKLLAANAVFFILWVGFFALAPGINGVDSYLNSMYGSVGRNGLTVGGFISISYGLFFDAIVLAVAFDILYLIASAVQTEATEDVFSG